MMENAEESQHDHEPAREDKTLTTPDIPVTVAAPPPRLTMTMTKRWIADSEMNLCEGCGLMFDWIRRKHHCRYCGHIFCDLCTSKRCLLPQDRILFDPARDYLAVNIHNPQRVCERCADEMEPEQEQLRRAHSNAVQPAPMPDMKGHMRYLNSPFSLSLQQDIRQAAISIQNFLPQYHAGVIQDQSIPLPLISNAKGLAFLTVAKAGFFVSGRFGTGLVIAKLPDHRWSAPSAIGTAGVGWGLQIGGEVTDFVIILNTRSAVDMFCASGSVTLGAELGISAGPIGRTAAGSIDAGPSGLAPCYTYSHSKGLFAGVSLEGSIIAARTESNRAFYGKDISPREILVGTEPNPEAAMPLYAALDKVMVSPANAINRFSVPASE